MEQLLEQLGFNKTEALVYLSIVELGKATPARVAKLTGINRTTVYSTADELVKMGVVSEDLGGRSMYLVANPEGLNEIIKRGRRELKSRENVVEKAIEELSQVASRSNYSVPRIRFVEERELKEHLYKQNDIWNKSITKICNMWWGFQDHTFVEHYGDWIVWYWQNAPKEISLKLLSNESKIEEEMKGKGITRREIKLWRKPTQFSATVWAIGEYLVMIETKERPHYLVEIHDAVLAHNMREYFKNTWSLV